MTDSLAPKEQLRVWIAEQAEVDASLIADDKLVVDEGYLSPVAALDLMFLIEDLSGTTIDATELDPNSFESVNSIMAQFFGNAE